MAMGSVVREAWDRMNAALDAYESAPCEATLRAYRDSWGWYEFLTCDAGLD